MSVTIKQFARYRIIDECLQNNMHIPSTSNNPEDRGIWPIVDLIDAITQKLDLEKPVSDRTVKEDIYRMKKDEDLKYSAPIKNKFGIGYYYSDPTFNINGKKLSPAEEQALSDVVGLLKQFKGFKYFEGIEGLIHSIEEQINHSEFLDIQFDVLPDYRGLEYIDTIKKAIQKKQVLKMTYKAFYEEAAIPRHIHPYLLKEYNNRWFVYAYTNEYKSEGVYGLDRIIRLVKTDLKYRDPCKNNIINYFKDIIGVTNFADRKIEKIVVRLNVDRAKYLITKPIHHSQKLIESGDDYIWFEFKLKPNNELAAWILSFGKDIVVEEPDSLVKEIKGYLQKAYENYL